MRDGNTEFTDPDELEAWRLLPWLANDTLRGNELERVVRQLEHSPVCRQELLFLSELRRAVETTSADRLDVSEDRLARLMERIDRHEQHRTRTALPASGAAAQSRRHLVTGLAAGLLLTLLVSLLWWSRTEPSEPPAAAFRTLSEGPALSFQGTQDVRFRVVFEEGSLEMDIRSFLLEIDAEIVAGPNRLGAYTVRLKTSDSHQPLDQRRVEQLLDHLRENPLIGLIELEVGIDA